MVLKRKDINAIQNSSEIDDYIHALNILRARSQQNPDDETGYDFQAALHNDFSVGPCEHGNDLFFAWHRAHLHYFEKLLQESDSPRTANVTVPYWDWLHTESGSKFPLALSKPGLSAPGRNENPVPLAPDTLEIVTTERNWNAFGGYPEGDPNGDYGRLELGPHNYMHGFYIGGKMGSPSTAAEDAIYWSFHCFIDLLWSEWQRRNNSPSPTSPDADLRGFLSQPKHKVRDFQSTTALNYEYEYTDKLREAFGMSQPDDAPHNLIAVEPLQSLFGHSMESELREKSRVQFAFPTPPTAPAAVIVRLRDLKVPTKGSYMLRAYVHPKDVPFDRNDATFHQNYYAGYVALWKSHEMIDDHGGHGGHEPAGHGNHPPQPHHPTACTVRFDVTQMLSKVTPEAASDLVLTLQYIPAPGSTGEPEPVPELIKEVNLKEVLMEVYG